MYTVEYGYYNFPRKVRKFKTYAQAKNFFYYIGRCAGVKKVELIGN